MMRSISGVTFPPGVSSQVARVVNGFTYAAALFFAFFPDVTYCQTAAAAPIHIVSSIYEPYRITRTTGITVELIIAACHAAGLPIDEIEMLPPERARVRFENDPNLIYLETNAYIDTVKNPKFEIAKQWQFQVLIYYDKSQFAEGGPKAIADLAGKVMGYFRADIATKDYFSKQGVIMTPLDQQSQLYPMLLHQRIAMLISTEDNAQIELEKLDTNWRAKIGAFGPYYAGWSGPVYHKDNPAAVEFIDRYLKGYRRIQSDGTVRTILERYYGKGMVPAAYLH
jgi:hypothetical protein